MSMKRSTPPQKVSTQQDKWSGSSFHSRVVKAAIHTVDQAKALRVVASPYLASLHCFEMVLAIFDARCRHDSANVDSDRSFTFKNASRSCKEQSRPYCAITLSSASPYIH